MSVAFTQSIGNLSFVLCGLWGLGASINIWAWNPKVRHPSPRLWTTRELLTPGILINQSPSKGFHLNTKTKPTERLASTNAQIDHVNPSTKQKHSATHWQIGFLKPYQTHSHPQIYYWTQSCLQRDKIQLHWQEHRHKSLQPGNHQRILASPPPEWVGVGRGTAQLRRTMTLWAVFFFFFFFFKSHCGIFLF